MPVLQTSLKNSNRHKRVELWAKSIKISGFRTPFALRDVRKNPRSMYPRVPQTMAQFVQKIENLSHIMGTASILEMARAYGLRPWLWLLVMPNECTQDSGNYTCKISLTFQETIVEGIRRKKILERVTSGLNLCRNFAFACTLSLSPKVITWLELAIQSKLSRWSTSNKRGLDELLTWASDMVLLY